MIMSMIDAPRRIQKPMYSTAAAAGGGGSTVVTKTAPQLAQKRASEGLSCPQILHFTLHDPFEVKTHQSP